MFKISHIKYGWYAAFRIGYCKTEYTSKEEIYKYFGTSGWNNYMSNGNNYFNNLEDLMIALKLDGIKNGKIDT